MRAESSRRFPFFQSQPVSYLRVKMLDAFWAPRQLTTHRVSVAWISRGHDRAGGLHAFEEAPQDYVAQTRLGEMEHVKFIEAMATVAGVHSNPAIGGLIDAWVAPLLANQAADGYLAQNFPHGSTHPTRRWQPAWWSHEDYLIGHYLDAAMACREALRRERLYASAVRAADNMAGELLDGRHAYAPGHPQIEQALMRLYGLTGDSKYLRLCGWLLDQRGRHQGRESYGRYSQDHVSIKSQRTIEGHAVRAAYLFNGVTLYVGATGDARYQEAVLAVWRNLVDHKLYLHGAAGNLSAKNEGYRRNPDCLIPSDVYGETCAVVGNFQWAHNLARLTGDAQYLDAAERMLYNAFASALSLAGDSSFYCNVAQTDPLDHLGKPVAYPHSRSTRAATECCPPNIVKLLNKVGGFFYSTTADGICVNHYGACEARIPWGAGVTLTQHTAYPWDGAIALHVEPAQAEQFTLRLRCPQWAHTYRLLINGRVTNVEPQRGWLSVRRAWVRGDRVELVLPMTIERVTMPQRFTEYENRIALQRGPIMYCLEGQDLDLPVRPFTLAPIYIPQEVTFTPEHRDALLGGVTLLRGGVRLVRDDVEHEGERTVSAQLVPYAVWGNRDAGPMRMWLSAARAPMVDLISPHLRHGESCLG